jgi:hypothetical protein
MQTFLPYPDFAESARVLDRKRLGKQRSETVIIYKSLVGAYPSGGWDQHPATKMWAGCEDALAVYGRAICLEWRSRGYRDTLLDWFQNRTSQVSVFPSWMGNENFHRSHRSNLLRKDPVHYRQYWPDEPDDLPYIWPVSQGGQQ